MKNSTQPTSLYTNNNPFQDEDIDPEIKRLKLLEAAAIEKMNSNFSKLETKVICILTINYLLLKS